MSGGWPQTQVVLTEAVKLSKGDRRRFLAEACVKRPELRSELLAILETYDTASHLGELPRSDGRTLGAFVPNFGSPSADKNDPILRLDNSYGPYRVLKQLGAGGMGQVFLAQDVRLNRRVAVKSLAGKWLESPTARQRLMREARSAAALSHPNIATLYDVIEDSGHLLLVMEYVEGQSVSSRLEEGAIPIGHALRLAIQIADAVSYAHDRGILHCDIKPANVQIAADGSAKVLDFGLARARYDAGDGDELTIAEQGKLIGTLGYMPPERLLDGTVNASGDTYSLGVVVFEMVTGQRFFDDRDLSAFLLLLLGSDMPKPSGVVSWVPTALDEIVERAIANKPSLRYQSARELSRDLQNVLALVEGSRVPVSRPAPSRFYRPFVVAAIAAALVTLAGFATSVMYNSAFGITASFQTESIFSWPLWGIRSLVAPVFYVGRALVAVVLLFSVWRLCLFVPPIRRWWEGTAASRHAFTEPLQSLPTVTLAQALLIVHSAVIALNFWYFSGFMQGFDMLIMRTTPGSLAQLGPAHHADHLFYREVLSLELGVFAAAWLTLFALRRKRGESWIDVGIVGSLLVVFTLFLLALPYRVIFHNEHERVLFGSDTCYVMSQRGNEGLLFCPMRNPPRSQIVRLDDVRLVRGGDEEDVFSRVGQGR